MQKMREILKLQLFDLTKHKLIRSRPIELSSLHAKFFPLSGKRGELVDYCEFVQSIL